mmetsp:Transcript_33649/g.76877  ORF Transcript_33649/g.76877 Transcript_33649/m.76877 type:complete len:81 (-) Transcript_33649:1174-1416(-)
MHIDCAGKGTPSIWQAAVEAVRDEGKVVLYKLPGSSPHPPVGKESENCKGKCRCGQSEDGTITESSLFHDRNRRGDDLGR